MDNDSDIGESVKVSVLMSVFNGQQFLTEAIESILDQTWQEFEFIIVDDGSTDKTPEILKQYAQKDRRIKVLTNDQNIGIVKALNRGLSECRGKYIIRMDSDDISLQHRIMRQVTVMNSNPDTVVLGAAVSYIDAAGNDLGIIRHSRPLRSLLAGNMILHPTTIIRRNSLIRNGLKYLEKYRYAEDYYLWLELSRTGSLHAIEDVVLKYRMSERSTRMRHLKEMLQVTFKVKWDAMHNLHLKPNIGDLVKLGFETMLMCLPRRLILWLYLKKMFGFNKKIRM